MGRFLPSKLKIFGASSGSKQRLWDPGIAIRAIFSSVSRIAVPAPQKAAIDGTLQPLFANRLRHNIDRAAEDLLEALPRASNPAEIGKAIARALGLNRMTTSTSELSVGIAASQRSEDRYFVPLTRLCAHAAAQKFDLCSYT
jgi:hypothetical protein